MRFSLLSRYKFPRPGHLERNCRPLFIDSTAFLQGWMLDGSDPLFEALVRAWGGAGFHMRRPAPSEGRSRPEASLREGS